MQTDGSDRRLQFVGNSIDKAVVLLAAAKLTDQKAGVDDHPCDNQGKEDDAEEQQYSLAPVEDDPSDIEGNRQRHQGYAQDKEEYDGSAAARDAHGVRLILARLETALGLRIKILTTEDTEEHRVSRKRESLSCVPL